MPYLRKCLALIALLVLPLYLTGCSGTSTDPTTRTDTSADHDHDHADDHDHTDESSHNPS